MFPGTDCGVWLQVFSRTKWYRFPKLRVYVHIEGSEFGAREREEKNFFFKRKDAAAELFLVIQAQAQ